MRLTAYILCLLALLANASGQESYRDTLVLRGPSVDHLSEYATYWVDEEGGGTLDEALAALDSGQFAHWPIHTTLNLGLNPHPLWIRLIVRNEAPDPDTYWWSLYSHADTVVYFRKSADGWIATDTARFNEPYDSRDVRVRFLSSEVYLKSGETAEMLMRVRNLRRAQNAVIDITTPDHNLQWEKKFFWTIGFVTGGLMLVAGLNLVLGFITRQRPFFLLVIYVLIVNLVILQEELLIVLYPIRAAVGFFMRFPAFGLVIVGCGLHYLLVRYMVSPARRTIVRVLDRLNLYGLIYGLLLCLAYFVFYENIHAGQWAFRLLWYVSGFMILLMMAAQMGLVFLLVRKPVHILFAIFTAAAMLYFSPAGYFLNYEGIVPYYTITYPNYFFWGLCAELLIFGIIIGWRYRRVLKNHAALLEEKARHQADLYLREIQTQERERMQIARDLHDDLGATISAINLVVTNSYKTDSHLVKMVSKANKDLRFFLSNFSGTNIRVQGCFNAVRQKVAEMNALGKTKFTFRHEGADDQLPEDMRLAVFRMVTELMANVVKHAEASKADIQIVVEATQVLIIVEDNGRGYDTHREYPGMGLQNLQNRASAFGGQVHTTSDTRSGTTTIITLPLAP